MKKHGIRMELAGGMGLFLLALISDAGMTSVAQNLGWMLLCTGTMLLGYRFTLPRKRRARAAVPAVAHPHAPAPAHAAAHAPMARPAA